MKKRELGKEVETGRRARFFLSKKIETAIKSLHRNRGSVRLSFNAVRVAFIGTETEVEYGLLLLYGCIKFSTSFEALSCTEIEVFIDCTGCINCCTDNIYYSTEIETVRCIYFAGTIFLGCTVCILLAQKTRVYGWFAEHKFPDFGIKSVVEISSIFTVFLSYIFAEEIINLSSL